MLCIRINIIVWTNEKPSTLWRNRFPKSFFYIILLRPKTVLLLKEFIVKYSPFIQHNFGQMVKMNRKTTASDGVVVCLDLKNKLMFEEKTIILYCCVIHFG